MNLPDLLLLNIMYVWRIIMNLPDLLLSWINQTFKLYVCLQNKYVKFLNSLYFFKKLGKYKGKKHP